MKPDEAIKYIIQHCNPDYPKGKTEWETAINMAISALEKQIPQKIVSKDDYEDCPVCGEIMRYRSEGYCDNCGQKYVWTEEEKMVPTETKNLHWKDAWFYLLNGRKIKRPLWEGYWKWENNTIMMHCRDGSVTDIRTTDNPAYTFTNIAQRDWMVVEE